MNYTVALKENCDFKRLYHCKKSAVSPYFVVYCRRNCLGFNRLGLTAGVKLGCAVERNRMRRRVKEVYRLCENSLSKSYDMVIVIRSRSMHADFAKMRGEFLRCAEALSILRGENSDGVELK